MSKLSFILAFTLAGCLGAAPANAIVFGEEIKSASSDYPWVASV